jgi:hypothetical protein
VIMLIMHAHIIEMCVDGIGNIIRHERDFFTWKSAPPMYIELTLIVW